jgi:transcriptional regulator with XRE-family HTH domain
MPRNDTKSLEKIRESVARNVRQLRQGRNWTQQALASRLGLSQARLSEIERGDGSFSAEQLICMLTLFNATVADLAPPASTPSRADALQNALARMGARHLLENPDALPSERRDSATTAVRETLVLAEHPRLITALAPVIVQNIDALNLHQVSAELAQFGLQRRLGWVVENTADAIERLRPRAPRALAAKYRGAAVILGNFLGLAKLPLDGLPGDPKLGIDFLDRTIRTERTLDEVIAASSPISKRWRIATSLQLSDFAAALKDAHGLD